MSIQWVCQWAKSVLLLSASCFSIFAGAIENNSVDFLNKVQPLLNRRCAACHSCYQAPCQVKLNSWEGITRGVTKEHKVYNPSRLKSELPTRLFQDALTTDEWRNTDFFPIVPDSFSPNDSDDSFIMRLVNQKTDKRYSEARKRGKATIFPEESRECPTTMAQLNKHLQKNANYGMPYGLTALSKAEHTLLNNWTKQGSQGPTNTQDDERWSPSSNKVADSIHKWEEFLNTKKHKNSYFGINQVRLVSRYIYEHLFMGNINFDPNTREFYRLVRTIDQCDISNGGRYLREIKTRRPFGNPIAIGESVTGLGKRTKKLAEKDNLAEKARWKQIQMTNEFVERPYQVKRWIEASYQKFNYCFKKVPHEITVKSHMLYQLNDAKMDRFNELFFNPRNRWDVPSLPGFVDEVPGTSSDFSNPFIVFADIPASARYKFLLEDSEYTIRTFIRGLVCRGGTAVNSIDEQFFVFFVDPDSDLFVTNKKYAETTYDSLRTTPHYGSDIHGYFTNAPSKVGEFWARLKKEQSTYRRLRANEYAKRYTGTVDGGAPRGGYSIKDLWRGVQGEEFNKNSVLTVMRHFDSASVSSGAIGSVSKTAFVLDYPLLERFVYNLAAGYDVLGDLGHQLLSRSYMSYLRTEGEMNFLDFLPSEKHFRKELRNSWYQSNPETSSDLDDLISTWVKLGCKGNKYRSSRRRSNPVSAVDDCHPLYNIGAKSSVEYNETDRAKLLENFGFLAKAQFFRQAFDYLGATVENGLVDLPLARQLGMETSLVDPVKDELLELATHTKGITQGDPGAFIHFMPNLSYLHYTDDNGNERVFSIIRNKAHYNILLIGAEAQRRNHALDTLTIADGFVGMYPNMFFSVTGRDSLKAFVNDIKRVKTPTEYDVILDTYGAKKESPRFWSMYDQLYAQSIPQTSGSRQFLEGGIIDLNRYGIDYTNDMIPDLMSESLKNKTMKFTSKEGAEQ